MKELQRQVYLDEAAELLSELEVSLLQLEEKPEDAELIGRIFRGLHTIKGSGAMFGFDAIASFTHQLETAFEGVREGRVPVTPDLVGIALDARDHIQRLLRDGDGADEQLNVAGEGILKRLKESVPDGGGHEARIERHAELPTADACGSHQYRIRFEPHPDILLSGNDPILLLGQLRELGECRMIAHLDQIPDLEAFDPEVCYTRWNAFLTAACELNTVRDLFLFVEDRADVSVDCVDGESTEGLVNLDEAVKRGGGKEQLVEIRHSRAGEPAATLRVSADKLDSLVNIVGELVTVQARLSGYASASGSIEAALISEDIERLTERLRETTMSVRMLPIRETFSRFKRLVRDLSAETGKRAELITEGDDTELDKTVIEQLSDPLVHLVRNAVDHGIELPEQRVAAGKPAHGSVRLSARHAGTFVLIEVGDDGAGIDRDRIRARAVEKGMVPPGTVLSDEEALAMIFKPGFSTAEKVTEISGRGVGMDVVQRSLDALHGALTVDSELGRGSSVTLRIPLTLAIIDGLLVEAAGAFYVVPLSNISECIEMPRRTQGAAGRHTLIDVRGELTPYIVLRDHFGLTGEPPPIEQVIVAETREGRRGFVVDRVIGDHHTVIKKLGSLYRQVEEISGATILGDGSVALILDVEKLTRAVIHEKSARAG